MKRIGSVFAILFLLIAASLHAHAQAKPAVDAKHAQEATGSPAKPAATAKPTETPAPALTPAEAQQMADYDQQLGELLQKMIPLQQKRAAFVNALNSEHPGWLWYDAKVQGETSGFRKSK